MEIKVNSEELYLNKTMASYWDSLSDSGSADSDFQEPSLSEKVVKCSAATHDEPHH